MLSAPAFSIQGSYGTTIPLGPILNSIFNGLEVYSFSISDRANDDTQGFWSGQNRLTTFQVNGAITDSIWSADLANATITLGSEVWPNLWISAVVLGPNGAQDVTTWLPILPVVFNDPTPGQATASDVVAAAYQLLDGVGGITTPNGCHSIAMTIAAVAGAPLPVDSGSIVPSENIDGGYWTAIHRGSVQNYVANWSALLQPGDVVRYDYSDPSEPQHTFVVLEVSGTNIKTIDNWGQTLNLHWEDYQYWANPASVTIYRITEDMNTLRGDTTDNYIIGSAARDRIFGNEGNDLIGSGIGNDALYGGEGADVLDGGLGHDMLFGGTGADELRGGAGLDYARYDDAAYGDLRVSLAANAALGNGAASGDTFVDIEGIISGAGNDWIYGNNSGNRLYGGAGDDMLFGSNGADYIHGGAGFDFVRFDEASYAGLQCDLAGSNSNTGAAKGDTYVAVEGMILTANGDFGYGDANANYLYGLGGGDMLNGRGGADNLIGGVGTDTLTGGTGNDVFWMRLGYGRDTVTDFAGGTGVVDRLDLRGCGFASFAAVLAKSVQVGANLEVRINSADVLVLNNFLRGNFASDDVILV